MNSRADLTINKIDTSMLPLSLRELSGVIDFGPAFDLVEAYNGLRLYIPAQAHQEHGIADVVGFSNMKKLCEFYHHYKNPLPLPKLDKALIQLKHQTVVQMSKTLGTREISRRTGYTPRRVQQICSDGIIVVDPNMDLFRE
jgi:hypothetical protein